ncbi:MAG TPA: nucleotidyltransferase domain-containing protein [Caldisericia bacterium]|nr:nucleotidyltransferase domain-containing protein [Caldisericia bacterium]
MYGLLERDLHYMIKAFVKHPEIDKVILFGSRAMGNYKRSSDVDLAIIGDNVDTRIIAILLDDLNEEFPIPYYFDVIHYQKISNEELKKHIDTEGIVLWEK